MIAFGQPPRPMFGMRHAMTGERDDAGGQFMPGMRLGQLMGAHTGGNLPAQVGGSYMPAINPQTGGQLPPQQFQPMTGGALQAQSGYPMQGGPQSLAAMFRNYRPYQFG